MSEEAATLLRTLIVDDEPLAIERMQVLCAEIDALSAIGTASDGKAALRLAGKLSPDLVLLDMTMPGMDGLELQQRLKEMGIGMPIIVMTGHADVPLAVQAMKAGAVDFIEKPFNDDVLLSAVRIALKIHEKGDISTAETSQVQTKLDSLSTRERQVLEGLLAGHPNKTIAYDLSLSPRTVEVHRANVMTKMGANSLSELVRMTVLAKFTPEG